MGKKFKLYTNVFDGGVYLSIKYENITDSDEIRALYERSDEKESYSSYESFRKEVQRENESYGGEESEPFKLTFYMHVPGGEVDCAFLGGNHFSSIIELDEQEKATVRNLFVNCLKKIACICSDDCHRQLEKTHSKLIQKFIKTHSKV